jgi:hypothetical protein
MKKKVLVVVMTMSLLLGCSSDDNSIPNYGSYSSSMMIAGNAFLPNENNETGSYITTSSSTVNNVNYKIFHLEKNTNVFAELEVLHFSLKYPTSMSSIDGSYTIVPYDSESEVSIFGSYKLGSVYYYFSSGVIKINDLEDNKYKFIFSNVVVKDDLENTKTINGVFIGDFIQP